MNAPLVSARWTRLVAVPLLLLSVAAVLFVSASPAAAHATMISATPTPDKVVPEAPAEVVVKFSESVSVVASGTGVTAPDGSKAHAATPVADGELVRYRLRDDLPDGTYVVSYRVISADGHPVPGGFTFSIGSRSQVPEAAEPGGTADPLVSGLVLGNRFAGYAGLLLVFGPALLLLAGDAGSRRGALRLTMTGLSLVAGTAVIGLYLQAPYTAGTTLFGVTGADIGSVLGSRFGGASLARLLLVLIAVPLLWHALARRRPVPVGGARSAPAAVDDASVTVAQSTPDTGDDKTTDAAAEPVDRPADATSPTLDDSGEPDPPTTATRTRGTSALSPGTRRLLVGLAVALAVTWPVSGHATTSAAPALTVISDTVHIAAATVWLGGLVTLAFFGVKRSRTAEAETFLPTWSRWATWIVASLAIAGLAQALIHIGTVSGLISTAYGWLVIAKIVLFGILLVTAALARKAVQRIGDRPVVTRVRRLILTELVVGALVLGLSTVLVQAVPAQSVQAEAADAAPETYSKTFETDLYTLQFELEPVKPGRNQAHLYLFETDGVTELEATEWKASFGQPDDGVALIPFDLALLSPNHTSGDVDIPRQGKWTFEFTIRISELERETVSTVVSVK